MVKLKSQIDCNPKFTRTPRDRKKGAPKRLLKNPIILPIRFSKRIQQHHHQQQRHNKLVNQSRSKFIPVTRELTIKVIIIV